MESADNPAMSLVKNIGPAPTLGQMVERPPRWVWVCCGDFPRCLHQAPMAIVPLIIRWGWDITVTRYSDLVIPPNRH
jgi:hypothetical protein